MAINTNDKVRKQDNTKKTSGFRASFYWNVFVLLGSSAGTTVICLLLGLGMMDIVLFYNYFRHPLLFLLNGLPVFLLQLLLLAVFNCQWLAFFCSA